MFLTIFGVGNVFCQHYIGFGYNVIDVDNSILLLKHNSLLNAHYEQGCVHIPEYILIHSSFLSN
jgi:hypothetical protein